MAGDSVLPREADVREDVRKDGVKVRRGEVGAGQEAEYRSLKGCEPGGDLFSAEGLERLHRAAVVARERKEIKELTTGIRGFSGF